MTFIQKLFVVVFCSLVLNIQAQTKDECRKEIEIAVREMHKKNHVVSLELLTKTNTITQQNAWHEEQFLSLNNIGLNYFLMLDYGEALDYYFEAYKIALRELNDPFEMIVLNNIAILYSKEKQFDKAEEFFDKAFVLAHENKDSVKIGFYAINLATVANEQKETSKAEFYTKIAEQHLAQNPQFSFYIPLTKAQTFLLQKDYTKVHQEIDKIFPKLKTVEMTEHRINAFLILSDAFMGQNNNQKAEEFLTKARLVKPQTIENKINIFDRMVDLNRNLNRFDLAFAYKDSVMLAKDSLHIIKNGKQFENSKIKFS